ncbi:MAG: DUF2273 domain-containing protein [Loktanella sp.]|nr:DUF2273 domain-containing protein [Loktanella sp.]
MSHSENNLDRQVKRHKGPLIGISAGLIFVAIILFWWLGTEAAEAPGPTDTTDDQPAISQEVAPDEASSAPQDVTIED